MYIYHVTQRASPGSWRLHMKLRSVALILEEYERTVPKQNISV
jgi:hypothetical protein